MIILFEGEINMRFPRKYLLYLFIFVAFTYNAIAWASASETKIVNISPASSTLASGEPFEVEALSGTTTTLTGKAQVINGVELFKLNLGEARYSDILRVHMFLMNPQQIGKVLNNPNSFIEVAVWYEDGTSSISLSDGTKVTRDESAIAYMSQASGDIVLRPTIANKGTLYILASINVLGGYPPGQQTELQDLQFYCDVRL
jgi:hypothetical protein